MKTSIRALLLTILFAAFGVFLSYGAGVLLGTDPEAAVTDRFSSYMTDAKAMFLEKPDAFQFTAMNFMDKPGTEFINGNVPGEYETEADGYVAELFSDYVTVINGSVRNVAVTNDGVLFFTSYDEKGVVGIIYEFRENSTPSDYETMEILEEWKLFYRIAD
ncbi:MAG: hypothetical protein LBN97_00765 [Oscillospiraceae bacterium]|jgi:hypothetical protein|nr:hypothetical protein [Oscillospiraceae bacterium]